jgi:2-polyprenyl-6-methoxyphenol hydroxylase-like FAD-dependent oxidoreductase
MQSYDIITVGGGLGGSALAKVMAERGARVLVVERESHFKDRVRGEALAPWGVENVRRLGLFDLLAEHGNMLQYWRMFLGGNQVAERDFFKTTPQQAGFFCFYHPTMQEILIEAAAKAGAEVRRGAHVREVEPGSPARVTIERGGNDEEASARLVVGADGRGSKVRHWGGFTSSHDPDHNYLAGLLLDGFAGSEDSFYFYMDPSHGKLALFFPQGKRRVRAYYGHTKDWSEKRLGGAHDVGRFIEHFEKIGMPGEYCAKATPSGPLATFAGADSWVDHPYKNGIVLIGDAASTSDQTWGQGLSLATRDVCVLVDCLAKDSDWHRAGDAYAEQHDWHYGVIHRVDRWYTQLFMEIGPEAEERRARAFPLIAADPTRVADCPISGPEAPHDDAVRARFFGEA